MKNDILQKELFREFDSSKTKAGKKMHGSILPKNYVPLNISHEQFIFITIGVIMLMVLVFSLGVERGKRMGTVKTETKKNASLVIKQVEDAELAAGREEEPEYSEEIISPEPPKIKKPASTEIFTIQIIAYRSKKSAQRELMKLGKKGYSPFIILGGGYYQICVGEYGSQEESEKALSDFKKGYPDSFIRKR